jgi:hypothetical protein
VSIAAMLPPVQDSAQVTRRPCLARQLDDPRRDARIPLAEDVVAEQRLETRAAVIAERPVRRIVDDELDLELRRAGAKAQRDLLRPVRAAVADQLLC